MTKFVHIHGPFTSKKADSLREELTSRDFTDLSPEKRVARVAELIKKNYGGGDPEAVKAFLRAFPGFCDSIMQQEKVGLDELREMTGGKFDQLSNYSRRKVGLALMNDVLARKYDALDAESRTQLEKQGISRTKYIRSERLKVTQTFQGISTELVNALYTKQQLTKEAYFFLLAWVSGGNGDNDKSLFEVAEESFSAVAPETLADIADALPHMGMNSAALRKALGEGEDWTTSMLTGNYLASHKQESVSTSGNGFINPNWFLYDVDAEIALKLWGEQKTRYVFGRYLFHALKEHVMKEGRAPEFYNFCLFRIRPLDEITTSDKEKKKIDVAQHVFEWDLPDGLTRSELGSLVAGIDPSLPGFRISGDSKPFQHPVQSAPGAKNYYGYFNGARGFENTHIINISASDGKGQRLRLATDLGQDMVLFLTAQISHYLAHKKVLPAEALWRSIYELYNHLATENTDAFAVDVFRQQYDALVTRVVWPLSNEYRKKYNKVGKAHSCLLYGVPGTGKSQLMTHLLREKKYALPDGQSCTLDATVITIGMGEFADMLTKNTSIFRKRLSDIHEATQRPIVLVLEDIDTIISEQGIHSDPLSQALTTLFEGVGSLPVTVIASTNSPEKIPQRHMRPNRLDTAIGFSYPMSADLLKQVTHSHFQHKHLSERLGDHVNEARFVEYVLPHISTYTASHVGDLCQRVWEICEWEKVADKTTALKVIDAALRECLVPQKELSQRQESMSSWYRSLSSTGKGMGFI